MSTPHSITIHRTYQMKGYVGKKDFARIREVLSVCQRLYNRALAERKAVYRMTGKSITKFNQFKWLTSLRAESQELRDIAVGVQRGTLIRLDRAYQAFFRRVKVGEGYGFPRFKPWQRYTCIELATVYPGMVKNNRLNIKGLPVIRLKSGRALPDSAQLKSVRIVLHGRILSVDLVYAESVRPLPANDSAVGIDMGVNQRLTLSTGEAIERRKPGAKRQRVLQRAIARKKKGGSNRRKAVDKYARFMRKEAIRNRNECHRITTDLVRRFGRIAIEDLKIGNMTRKGGSHKRGLNREILGQSWGIIRQQLAYKVEWTGRQLTMVNPAYTSRICSECGEVQPKPREYRLFECSHCGHTEDRDVNAAKNIAQRGWGIPAQGVM